jgi:hypothetical protein
MRVDIDVSKLTLGELEFFEAESGLTFDELQAGRSNTKAVMALIVLQERRTNPAYSMDDARNIPLDELDVDIKANPPKPRRQAKAVS